jgi:transcriptional regulator with XRE-family HTH domain
MSDTLSSCRRPIEDQERPALAALGSAIAGYRQSAGLSVRALATAAELSPSQMSRIERGLRRTRMSTLARIATALGDPSIAADLAAVAGIGLAPESLYAERVARRRQRRHRKAHARKTRPLRTASNDGVRRAKLRLAQRSFERTDITDLEALSSALDRLMAAHGWDR